MTINFFIKQIYKEYNLKQLKNENYLINCLKNYTDKKINIDLLYFGWMNNILLDILYNITESLKYVNDFKQLNYPGNTTLLPHTLNENKVYSIEEKRIFWDKYKAKYQIELLYKNILDSNILDIVVSEIQFKPHLIENKQLSTFLEMLEEVVDAHFFDKRIILFLLEKDLLLEFLLNVYLKYKSFGSISSDILTVNDIYYAVNTIYLKYPTNVPELITFWYNINSEYLKKNKEPLAYFYNN